MKPVIFSLLIAATMTLVPAQAGVYKWVDENGKIHYGDQPPNDAELQDITGQISSFESVEIVDNTASDLDSESSQGSSSRKRVVIYSASWCPPCKKAKTWFKANNIPFKDYDVETTKKGKRDYKKLKGKGVPIILVGKKRLNGFSKKAFKAVYYN